MMDCIKESLARNAATIVLAATILAILAGIFAATGGLSVLLGPLGLGVISSALLAAGVVFVAIIAAAVLVIVANCALAASLPSQDEVPPEDDGIQPEDLQDPGGQGQALSDDPDSGEAGGSDIASPTKPRPGKPAQPPKGSPANPVGGTGPKGTGPKGKGPKGKGAKPKGKS